MRRSSHFSSRIWTAWISISISFVGALLLSFAAASFQFSSNNNQRPSQLSGSAADGHHPQLLSVTPKRSSPTFLSLALRGNYNENDLYSDNNKYEDDDDDDEPPSITTSPQEFLYRMQQRGSNNSTDEVMLPPAYGPGRGRSAPRIRPAFGKKTSSSASNSGKDAMATVYVCTNCGSEYVQWRGRCGTCMEWNTIQEYRAKRKPSAGKSSGGGMRANFGKSSSSFSSKTGSSWLDGIGDDFDNNHLGSGPVRVTDVYEEILDENEGGGDGSYNYNGSRERRTLVPDDPELNSVLGGGLMPGSISLVGGDPGVGKSTLLLQMAGSVASMAERSLQFQGIGMGPPKPSPTTSPEESVNPQNSDMVTQQQKQSIVSGGGPVLYISGEENANQIASRALRLGIHDPELLLWCETDADIIADTIANSMYASPSFFDDQSSDDTSTNKQGNAPPLSRLPSLVIIDSIQTMLCDAAGSSSAGGITQVRECVALFLRLAKSTGVPIMLVGHVTKSGDVAGPRTVEHMVDCVLYLEGGGAGAGAMGAGSESGGGGGMSSLRVLRAAKNRFGSSEEVGVYEMSRGGRLVPISDPSSFFLSTRQDNIDSEGCAISVVLEGIRSMTVEVQALVAWSGGSGGYSGRRIVDGISNSRLLLILAVLHKRYGISFHRRDVYVNVVGGMHLGKGSKSKGGGGSDSDLAVAVALASSLTGIPIRSDTAFVGEVGLLGEIRPVHALEKRMGEAQRMGFSRIVTPSSFSGQKKGRAERSASLGPREVSAGGIKQIMCENVLDAINYGLVSKLPTKQTRSGPKLIKPKRLRSSSENDIGGTNSFGMNELDIILDDEDDDIFE